MKALTVKPWWATAIWYEEKSIEFRTWTRSYSGPLLIHSSQEHERETFPGCALCVCDLIDIRPARVDDWKAGGLEKGELTKEDCEGLYSWVLGKPRTIRPVKCKGKQGLWTPDFEVEYIDDPAYGTDEEKKRFEEIWAPYLIL